MLYNAIDSFIQDNFDSNWKSSSSVTDLIQKLNRCDSNYVTIIQKLDLIILNDSGSDSDCIEVNDSNSIIALTIHTANLITKQNKVLKISEFATELLFMHMTYHNHIDYEDCMEFLLIYVAMIIPEFTGCFAGHFSLIRYLLSITYKNPYSKLKLDEFNFDEGILSKERIRASNDSNTSKTYNSEYNTDKIVVKFSSKTYEAEFLDYINSDIFDSRLPKLFGSIVVTP